MTEATEAPQPPFRDTAFSVSASAGATVTSAWACSYLPLGTKGTLIGLAAGSVLSGTASALYLRWVKEAHKRVRGFKKPAEASVWDRYYRPSASVKRWDIPWKRASAFAVVICVLGIAGVTVAEAAAGKPLSAAVRGSAGSGYTFGSSSDHAPRPAATVTPSLLPSPSPSVTVTTSPSPSPAVTASPSVTTSPSPSPVATVVPSPSPDGVVPSGTP